MDFIMCHYNDVFNRVDADQEINNFLKIPFAAQITDGSSSKPDGFHNFKPLSRLFLPPWIE